jgi:hypothetical protein
MLVVLRFFQRRSMRPSLRIVLLAALTAVLVLATATVAAAKGGPKDPPSNNPHAVLQPDGGQAALVPAAGQGAVAQPGGCQTSDPTVTGSGNVVVNPNGATNFTCHGALPSGSALPDRPVKVDLGDCDTLLTPSGRVRTICHSRP